ncbi:MAG: DNA repair protein RadA [Flavobacteriales bacterium]|nr:DNA repair protein RadA [Flavobacteriales bacterium]
MAKVKTVFFCTECGNESPKWVGKCPSCHAWNTLVEERFTGSKEKSRVSHSANSKPQRINEVQAEAMLRIDLKDQELNRVLGGGLVPGSVVLFGGEPGIGKSTLLLQIALKQEKLRCLYVSGEESASQIKMRAERLSLHMGDCYVLTETNTHHIIEQVQEIKPDFIIVDSIQTMFSPVLESSPGSVSQIRETTADFIRVAKESALPVFLIGHITKDGALAGPKVLEHMVDTVLQFEGDRNHVYRLLRSIKNRFGSTNELGIYEMQGNGLREVENPSEILINPNDEELSGSAIAATLEGLRPMLVEIQALVSTAVYGTPQRSATGFDTRRLNMLLAVLEKRCNFKLGMRDVFLNVAGGVRVDDPAIDLAVIAAVLSSTADVAIPKDVAFSAEVGLSGEIRPVNRVDQRIMEAQKLGFNRIYLSKYNKGLDQKNYNIQLMKVGKVEEVFRGVFG